MKILKRSNEWMGRSDQALEVFIKDMTNVLELIGRGNLHFRISKTIPVAMNLISFILSLR